MHSTTRFIIITGASSGIGTAIAWHLANDNTHLILTGRNVTKLKELKNQLASKDLKAQVIPADLSNVGGINDFIENVKKMYTSIDVVVNVAGIWHGDSEVHAGKNYETFDQDVIVDTLNVGILAPMLLVQACIPLMSKKAKIVNISGTFESGAKGWLSYYVSKRAIEDFTVGLAKELEDKDVQVNCVSPSDVATEAYKKYFPEYIKDAVEPEAIAKQVEQLCSADADFTTGKVLVVRKGKEPYEGFHT